MLCIDDEEDITRAIKLRLEHSGIDVICAQNGKDGVRLALEERPDAIVSDLVLPDGEGMFILRQIKSNPVTQHISVIILTGQGYESIKRQVLQAGAAAYLTKPVNFSELLQTIRMQVEESQYLAQMVLN